MWRVTFFGPRDRRPRRDLPTTTAVAPVVPFPVAPNGTGDPEVGLTVKWPVTGETLVIGGGNESSD